MKSVFLVLAVTVAIPLFSEASPQTPEEICLRTCRLQPGSSNRRNQGLSSCESLCRVYSIGKGKTQLSITQGTSCGDLDCQIHEQDRKDQALTTIGMVLEQSSYFRGLSESEQQAYIRASETNGFSSYARCSLEKLKGCNSAQPTIQLCASNQLGQFIQCVDRQCRKCGCAFLSLLGLDCDRMKMVRFIKRNHAGVFGNALLTPYVDKSNDLVWQPRLVMHHDGTLLNDTDYLTLTKKFENHKAYWEAKYGPIKPIVEEVEAAKTIIETADSLLDVIEKTKGIIIGDLQKEIDKIRTDVDGITEEAKKNIQEATTELYSTEVDVQRTRNVLESLAKETVTQVDSMLYYLEKVDDDWEAEKIAKFLRFQAKKMTELIERSLTLLEAADKLYADVQHRLSAVRAKLEAFRTTVTTLLDTSSQAYADKKKDYRLAVYIPCCVVSLGLACPVCVGILERKIAEWGDELNLLKNTINQNVAATDTLNNNVKENLEKLAKEVKHLVAWGAALNRVARIDYEFPEAELFGFADVRPRVYQALENLKTAANGYLERNFGKTD